MYRSMTSTFNLAHKIQRRDHQDIFKTRQLLPKSDQPRENILGAALCVHTILYSLVFHREAPLHLLFEESTLCLGNSMDPFIRNSAREVPNICHIQGPPTGVLLQASPSAELIFQYREYHWNLGNFQYSQYPYSPHNPLTYIPEKGLDDFLLNFLNLTTPPPTPSSIFFTQTTRLPQNLTSSHSILSTQPPRKSPTHPPQQQTKPKTPQTSNFASKHWSWICRKPARFAN